MSDSKELTHLFTGSMVLCHGLKSALLSHDIAVWVRDEYESARLAGFGSIPDLQALYVKQEDLEEAEDIKFFYMKNLREE